jgi:cytoskeletal protein RodZ
MRRLPKGGIEVTQEHGEQPPQAHQRIGARLFDARHAAGLTARQVSDTTRITVELLHRIEEGRFEHCGGDVYARGHIRAYAGAVGLDPEALLREYGTVTLPPLTRRDLRKPKLAAYSADEQREAARRDSDQRSPAQEAARRARSVIPTIVPGAVPSLVPMAGATPPPDLPPLRRGRRDDFTDADAGSAAALIEPAAADQPAINARPATFLAGARDQVKAGPNWSLALVGALAAVGVIAAVQLWPEGSDGAAQAAAGAAVKAHNPVTTPAVPVAPVVKPAVSAPPKPAAPVDVKIAATGAPSWVGVTNSAGQQLFSSILGPGQSQEFTDGSQLDVVVGNAAAVDLVVNGHDIGTQGGSGEVFRGQYGPGTAQ